MKTFHDEPILYVSSIITGFMEIPTQISMNIYVSGCMKRCKNCQNSSLWEFKKDHILDEKVLKMALKHHSMANWICFLGGDAVYQPKGLEKIAEVAKKEGKRVCLYTGLNFFELNEINKDNIDLIIDGEWEEEKGPVNTSTTNQKCYIKENNEWQVIGFYNLKDIKWDTKQHKDSMKDS